MTYPVRVGCLLAAPIIITLITGNHLTYPGWSTGCELGEECHGRLLSSKGIDILLWVLMFECDADIEAIFELNDQGRIAADVTRLGGKVELSSYVNRVVCVFNERDAIGNRPDIRALASKQVSGASKMGSVWHSAVSPLPRRLHLQPPALSATTTPHLLLSGNARPDTRAPDSVPSRGLLCGKVCNVL